MLVASEVSTGENAASMAIAYTQKINFNAQLYHQHRTGLVQVLEVHGECWNQGHLKLNESENFSLKSERTPFTL